MPNILLKVTNTCMELVEAPDVILIKIDHVTLVTGKIIYLLDKNQTAFKIERTRI